jgi:hypothetical protein
MVCLGGGLSAKPLFQEEAQSHKFLETPGMTNREIFQFAFTRNYIPILKVLSEKVGLDLLEEAAYEASIRSIQARAADIPKRDLHILAAHYKNPRVQNWFTMKVVEESDSAFEMKITECLWARIFGEADAAEMGFRCICRADYAIAEAFNPRIELVRDKTLMQGHSCCNHRYVMNV